MKYGGYFTYPVIHMPLGRYLDLNEKSNTAIRVIN